MKLFTIVGARPNFIKIDPELNQIVVHTGQHYDFRMSEIFFEGMGIPKPKYNLNCTDVGQMIDKLRLLFKREKPEMVVVIGDTNSALAGALAACMENIKIAHIESGLRSYDMTMPEEKNRVIIDRIADVRFCPNTAASNNLLKEGIRDAVHIVGDPLFDSLMRSVPIKKSRNYQQYVLLTMHRNFNVDNVDSLQAVMEAIRLSGEKVIFPIHPRTRKMIRTLKVKIPENVQLKQPVGYKQMLSLISNAKKVITDSGGVQREAFWMNVPVIILRNETEWTEIINKKGGILVGTDISKILDAIQNFKGQLNSPPQAGVNQRIREILFKYL